MQLRNHTEEQPFTCTEIYKNDLLNWDNSKYIQDKIAYEDYVYERTISISRILILIVNKCIKNGSPRPL